MTNRLPRKYIVFWLAHFTGNPQNKGWDTKLVHPRYADFDDAEKATALIDRLRKCEADGVPYCSRHVSHVTASWVPEPKKPKTFGELAQGGVWPFPGSNSQHKADPKAKRTPDFNPLLDA